MKDNSEKRRYSRLVKDLPIKIRAQDFDIITQTKNVSAIGAYCQINKYIAPMTKLNIVLLLPAPQKKAVKIQCEGVVARINEAKEGANPTYNIAVFFNRISKNDVNRIDKYIIKHIHKEGA